MSWRENKHIKQLFLCLLSASGVQECQVQSATRHQKEQSANMEIGFACWDQYGHCQACTTPCALFTLPSVVQAALSMPWADTQPTLFVCLFVCLHRFELRISSPQKHEMASSNANKHLTSISTLSSDIPGV